MPPASSTAPLVAPAATDGAATPARAETLAPKVNPYRNLTVRERLYGETEAMIEAALSRGKEMPPGAIAALETFEPYLTASDAVPENVLNDMVWAHHTLATLLAPATPRTLLLLHSERDVGKVTRLLGPISLIRHLALAAVAALVLFIVLSVSSLTNYDPQKPVSIMTGDGLHLLGLLLQYLAAAGIGASFVCLYKANRYVTEGTFDPMYIGSYWIRYFLGLISGLLLAVILHDGLLKDVSALEPGVDRILLAMLGGFSAELLYTLLNRLVEAVKSIFQGTAAELVESEVQRIKTRLAAQQIQNQTQLAAGLMRLQQAMGANANPDQIKQQLDALMNQVLPPQPGGK